MGVGRGKIDKGLKPGHSQKDNWLGHDEEKELGRRRRHLDKRQSERDALRERPAPPRRPRPHRGPADRAQSAS